MALPEAEALNNIGGLVRYMPWDGCPRSEYAYGLLASVVPGEGRAFVRFHLGDTAAACNLAQLDLIAHPVLATKRGAPVVIAGMNGKVLAESGHGQDGLAAQYQVQFKDGTFGWFPAMDVEFAPARQPVPADQPPPQVGQAVLVHGQRGDVVGTEFSHEGNITEYRVRFTDGSGGLYLARDVLVLPQ